MSGRINTRALHFSKLGWFVLVFFIVFCTDSALVNTNIDRTWARVSWVLILIGAVYFIPRAKFSSKELVYLLLFSLGIFSSMLMNTGFDINSIQRIVLIWLACTFAVSIDYDTFMGHLIGFLRFLAVFSTICIIIAPIIRMLPFPELNVGNGVLYKNLLFTNVSLVSDRNYGPFWEPGAFQLYLNWAVLYEIRNKAFFRVRDIIIFAICLITTRSTAGFLIFALIMIYFFINGRTLKGAKIGFGQVALVFMFLAALVGFVIMSEEISGAVFDKVLVLNEGTDEINSSNYSTLTRIYSVPASIEVIKAHPLFGVGIDQLKIEIFKSHKIISNTNSILSMPATFGIVPGLLYFILFLKASFKKNRKSILNILFFVILLAMFSTENMIASLMFWTLLFYEAKLQLNNHNQLVNGRLNVFKEQD